MTPFALNALRPTAAVQAVKPSLAGDTGLPTASSSSSSSRSSNGFAQLLTQHQTAPLSPSAQAAPHPAAAQPAPAAPTPTPTPTHTPERSATPPHERAPAARSADAADTSAPSTRDTTADAEQTQGNTRAGDAPASTAPHNTRGTPRGAKGTANARPASGTAHASSAPDSDRGGLAARGANDDAPQTDGASTTHPLAALLPGWAPPTVPGSATAPGLGGSAGEHAAATPAAGDAAAATTGNTAFNGIGNDPRAHPTPPTDDARQGSIALPGATATLARDVASTLPALAAQALAEREPGSNSPHAGSAPLGDFASQLAQLSGPTSTAPGASAATPVDVQLMTPATAPEFPDALGVQVSLLAQDGVQHAELHLNPAEMGPISVRIVIEGQQAQIDFGADSAQTRDILEAGLPELASALRDAGLTLSGGGVSQHPQPQQGGREAGDGHGSHRERGGPPRLTGADNDAASALAPLSAAQTRSLARRAAGGIDAYA